MARPRRPVPFVLLATAVVALASCASTSGGGTTSSGSPSAAGPSGGATASGGTVASGGTATGAASPGGASAAASGIASLHLVKSGRLTVATDSPAYDPWFSGGKPTTGKGFESAVAYAVAEQMGFTPAQVHWVTEPFNNSYAPGPKSFDFDVNEISVTAARQKAVDFSTGYYDVAQAVVALKSSKIAHATTLAALKDARLGAAVGTTSLSAVTTQVHPKHAAAVFNDNNDAKSALENGQIDGIVVDLPTAFELTAAEIKDSVIVGQFPSTGTPEQFGLLFEKGNPLVTSVDTALAQVKSSGELARLTTQWLGQTAGAPVLS